MKLQYISDLHLELRGNKVPIIIPVDPGNTYLALCGDIGNSFIPTYEKFLEIHTKEFVHILIISGNHEYYTSKRKQRTMKTIDENIEQIISKFKNVTYLNMKGIIIGRTKFIGCTYWSDVSKILNVAEGMMNDYENIYIDCPGLPDRFEFNGDMWNMKKNRIRPDRRKLKGTDVVSIHNIMKEWIESQISKKSEKYDNIIILTHHAPSFLMLEKKDILSPCYGTDSDYLFTKPITHWISGHTHFCKSIEINGIKSLSNCMGYPWQKVKNFGQEKFIVFN